MQTLLTGKEEGFTLLEVLVTMVLISIAVSLTLPSFNLFLDSITKRTLQRKVVHFFEQIRTEAITTNSTKVILIKDDRLIYKSEDGEEIELKEGIKKITSKQDNKDAIKSKISLFKDGTSSGATLIIKIQGGAFKISIDPITSKLQLEDKYEE